ncbi:MAG: hypothetical protein ACYDCH_00170 [Gaiellaceae bacterium]
MAQSKTVTVELSEYLSDQAPEALKGLLSAPISARIDRLLLALRGARDLGYVGPAELISALVHAQHPDLDELAERVRVYRNARVWETRESMGELTSESGKWRIRLRGPGERYG